MPFVAIFAFLSSIAGPLVARVLLSLGIGAVTISGMQLLINQAKQYVMSNFSGLPSDAVAIMGLAKVDVCINIMFAAVVTRAVVAGMNKATGSISKVGAVGKGS